VDGVGDGTAAGQAFDTSVVSLDRVRTPADFADCLDQLRKLAGPLSHRELERRGGKHLRRTKIGEVLGGDLPNREFLLAFLAACGTSEDEAEKWLLVWTRLVALPNHITRSVRDTPTGEPMVTRAEYDSARAEVRKLNAELTNLWAARAAENERATTTMRAHNGTPDESVRRELQKLRDERDAAYRSAQHATDRYDSRAARLRTTEGALDEALARVRSLEHELAEARNLIVDLSATVRRLRENQNGGQKELELAQQEIARLRAQLAARPVVRPPAEAGERRTRYTQGDPSVFVSADPSARPVIGE
jgi:hypothetical protein